MLAAMDEYAAKKEFLISVGADKARTLSNLILEEKPCVLVECGGYVGYSAILWADAMRWAVGEDQADDSTQPSVPHVWSLELSPEYAAVAAEMVGMTGLSEFVTIVVGPSEGSLGRLHAEGVWKQGIDVLFLDHVESLYVQDLKVCEGLGLLKAGTLILADNVVRPEAPDYDQYVRAHEGLESHGVKALIMPGEFEVCLFVAMTCPRTEYC